MQCCGYAVCSIAPGLSSSRTFQLPHIHADESEQADSGNAKTYRILLAAPQHCSKQPCGRTGPGQTAAPELENSSRRTASKSMHAELTDAMDGSGGGDACPGGGGGSSGGACLAGTGSGGFAWNMMGVSATRCRLGSG